MGGLIDVAFPILSHERPTILVNWLPSKPCCHLQPHPLSVCIESNANTFVVHSAYTNKLRTVAPTKNSVQAIDTCAITNPVSYSISSEVFILFTLDSFFNRQQQFFR